MRGLISVACLAALLAACATPAPPETVAAPPARPAPERIGPPPTATPEQIAAEPDDAPPSAPARQGREIIVPGPVEEAAPLPPGDPRTSQQRMRDIRAWDRCISRAQAQQGEDIATRPSLVSPEELCARRLGMSGRTAIPNR